MRDKFFTKVASLVSPVLLAAAFFSNSGAAVGDTDQQFAEQTDRQSVVIEEKLETIPTYPVGLADKNPIFYTGRVYQGAQGRVYPYAMRDILSDEKVDKQYRLLYLENEFVKIGIAPDLGGRILQGTDKTNGYEFFYRQHVIKPALIGMLGAWISGGVEWNIPHHHRPSSFMPIDWSTKSNDDGSKTVYVGETEFRHRMKWEVALTLYPGKSYVEANVVVENRSPFIQSMLSWANVSVHCDENYQVIFPPSVQFGTGHSKTEFCNWPIDNGVDISWWKNHDKYSRSVFAWDFDSDFLAGYDHKKESGTAHVGNCKVVGGKKFFLWGNHASARVWDEALSDEDGPYLELMVGGWSDNQPDYSWIGPYEKRRYKHYWFPISKIRNVKNANLHGALNLERENANSFFVGYSPTQQYDQARLALAVGEREIWSQVVDVAPDKPFVTTVALNDEDAKIADSEFKLTVSDAEGKELVAYAPVVLEKQEKPEPVKPFGDPKEYKTNEELYLAGLRLEQFHNGQRDPLEFYNEALSRDPGDSRVNTAVGLRALRNGKWAESARRFEKALERLEKRYTRVKDGEPHYYLGVAYRGLGREQDAVDQFWKATWTTEYQAAAFFQLAELAAKRGDYRQANELIDRSLYVNVTSAKAATFKAWTTRKLKEAGVDPRNHAYEIEANRIYVSDFNIASDEMCNIFLNLVVEADPLDYTAKIEQGFLDGNVAKAFKDIENGRGTLDARADDAMIRQQELLETVVDYVNRGAYEEANALLDAAIQYGSPFANVSTVWYYKGWALQLAGKEEDAKKAFEKGATFSNGYVFAFRPEERALYETVLAICPNDAQARYEYGMLLYFFEDKDEAIAQWNRATELRPDFANAWRNAGFAAENKGELDAAFEDYRKAVDADKSDPRYVYEYDKLAEKIGISANERLKFLETRSEAVFKYDDSVARLVELYNLTGQYDKALDALANRHFHVWEGGRDVHSLFVDARLLRGLKRLDENDADGALKDFQAAGTYPKNFEAAAPLGGGQNAKLLYLQGLAFEKKGDVENAKMAFEASVAEENKPDALRSEPTCYRVLALRKLGKTENAKQLETQYAQAVADEAEKAPLVNEYSKFGEEKTNVERAADSFFQQGLAARLEGNAEKAKDAFEKCLKIAPNNLWATAMRDARLD